MILVSIGFRGKWKQCGKVEVRLVDRGCLKIGFDDIWRFDVKKGSFRRTIGGAQWKDNLTISWV